MSTTTRRLRCVPDGIRVGDVIRLGGWPVTVEFCDPWDNHAWQIEGYGVSRDGTPHYVKVIVPGDVALTVERPGGLA